MTRSLKKLLYGLLYIGLFLFIGFTFYSSTTAPAPSCTNGIRDQGEEGIDCGGPCAISCAILKLNPIRVIDGPYVFSAGGKTVLLAEAYNPNSDYGASVANYEFDL